MALTYKDGKYYNDGNEFDPYLDMSKDEVDNYYSYLRQPSQQEDTGGIAMPNYTGIPAQNPNPAYSGSPSVPYTQGDENNQLSVPMGTPVAPQVTVPYNPPVRMNANTGVEDYGYKFGDPLLDMTQEEINMYGTGQPPDQSPAGQFDINQLLQLFKMLFGQGGQVATPQSQQLDTSYNDAIMALLTQKPATPQGSMEDYLPASSSMELSQALQDQAMQGLNAPYGYTPEEQALIRERAMSDFNANQDEDLQTLENRYQQYGLNKGGGLGGEAGNSLQTYFGKRATAMSNLEADLALQMIDRSAQDRQNAIANAMNINAQITGQYQQDFSNMLALMEFDQNAGNMEFDQMMDAAKFLSAEQQQNFLNQNMISQNDWTAYWKQREYEDSQSKANLDYWQEATGLSAADISQLMSWAGSNEASVLGQGMEKPDSALMAMLIASMFGGDGQDGGDVLIDEAGNLVLGGAKYAWDAATGGFKALTGGGDNTSDLTSPPGYDPNDVDPGNNTTWNTIKSAGAFALPYLVLGGAALGAGTVISKAIKNAKEDAKYRHMLSDRVTSMDDVTMVIAGNISDGASMLAYPDPDYWGLAFAEAGNSSIVREKTLDPLLDQYAWLVGLEIVNQSDDPLNINPDYPNSISVKDLQKIGKESDMYKQFVLDVDARIKVYKNTSESYRKSLMQTKATEVASKYDPKYLSGLGVE